MRICKNEITTQLKRLFNANPLRVPESMYQPLLVLEINNGKPYPLGQFHELIRGEFNYDLEMHSSEVAEFSGQKTKKINAKLGLNILAGFVKAFGGNPAKVEAALKKAEKLSFSFYNVKRRRFSPLLLGKILSENEILADTNNMFIEKTISDKNSKLAVVTDVITSNNFSIHTYDNSNNEVEVDIPAVSEHLGNVGLDVNFGSIKRSEIKFKKKEALTFAFCCVEIKIDDGKFSRGDWLTKLKSKNGENANFEIDENEFEYEIKIVFDDEDANPLLI